VSDLYQLTTKPPYGALIVRRHPITKGLLGFYPLNEGGGLVASDAMQGALGLTPQAYSGESPWAMALGAAANFHNAGSFRGVLPAAFQPGLPITLAVAFRIIGSPSASFPVWSVFSTNSSTGRVVSLEMPTTTSITGVAGGIVNTAAGSAFSTNQDIVVSCSFASGNTVLYYNGNQNAASAATYSLTYSATSTLAIGYQPGLGARNGQGYVYWTAWWNRTLTAAEHLFVGSSINSVWSIFQASRGYQYQPSIAVAPLFRRTQFPRVGSRSVA
jgi:hypothetical protein